MTNFKKFIPFLIVAILFAIGGYVAGNMGTGSQEAAVFKATQAKIGNLTYVWSNGICKVYDGATYVGTYGAAKSAADCKPIANPIGGSKLDTIQALNNNQIETFSIKGGLLFETLTWTWSNGICKVYDGATYVGTYGAAKSAADCHARINAAGSAAAR